MVELSTQIIREIKKAQNEIEVEKIVYDSITNLQKKNNYSSRSKRKFTFNLMVVLKYSKLKEHIPQNEITNLEKAIEIVIDLRNRDIENIF